MSSSSSNGVDARLNEAFEEMFDQQFDHTFDSIVDVQGNKPKRRVYIERDREQGHNLLWNDYFREHPTYPPEMFRRIFRMNKPLFLRIADRLSNEVPYFEQRKNAHGRYGYLHFKSVQQLYVCWHMVNREMRMTNISDLVKVLHFYVWKISLMG